MFLEFLKKSIFWPKRVFLAPFKDIFCTNFVSLLLGSSNLEYILIMWQFKNVYLEFLKKSIFRPKRVFLDFFLVPFWTSFAILLLGTSNSEYRLTMWQFKNVFLEFLKKSIFWPKRVFLDFFWTFFIQVSSFCCWGPINRNICAQYGNLRMCLWNFW